MNSRTKTGLEILQVAVIIGVLGDVLLRAMPWGLNVALFNAAFAGGMIMLIYRRRPEFLTAPTLALFGALVFFASMFAFRDSIELRVADTFAILTILSALFLPRLNVATQIAGVFHYIVGFAWSSLNALFAPLVLLVADVEWKNIPRTGWSKHLFSVLRGVAIVTPILLIFGGLFVAADAVYEGWVQRVFNIRPEIIFTHILLAGMFSWFSAGYLRGVLISKFEPVVEAKAETRTENAAADPNLSKVDNMRAETVADPSAMFDNLSILEHINRTDPPNTSERELSDKDENNVADQNDTGAAPKAENKKFEWANFENTSIPAAFTLGTVEIGIILGLINLLFLSFVIVQVPYLFGGMDLVQNTPDFKLAEYARRGFGELVAVSALVLPILLASHWLVRKDSPITEKLFRVFAGIQIVLLFVIMASAVQRLVLLTGNLGYGLTTIRLYPMIFMTWLAVVFVCFGLTVLCGARRHFAWAALWSAFLILGGTHFLNPDAFIVKTNIALMEQGRPFDAYYNANLSDDAIPALMDSFERLNTRDQQTAIHRIARRYCEHRDELDLRSWNFSRWNASRLINSNQDLVSEFRNCDSKVFIRPMYEEY